MRKLLLLGVLILMVGALPADAQSDVFTIKVDKRVMGLSDRVRVTYEASGSLSNFRRPAFDDFVVLGGPYQSQQTSYVNGRMSRSVSHSFDLKPKRTGNLSVPAAEAQVDGKQVRSGTVTIQVVPDSERPRDPNDPVVLAREHTFIRASISRKQVYVGEPVHVSYKLYYRFSIGDYDISTPELTGFYKEDLSDKNPETRREVYKGVEYQVVTLGSYLLIPQRDGALPIDGFSMDAVVNAPGRRRDFFGRSLPEPVNISIEAPTQNIKVLPLPTEGRPASFTGAVGDFQWSVSASKENVQSDESIDLELVVSGKGNLGLFDLPEVQIPNYFEVFDPQLKDRVRARTTGLSGSISKQYLVVSRTKGTYKVPPVEFSWFDPAAKTYRTATSEELVWMVDGGGPAPRDGAESQGSGIRWSGKQAVDYLQRDVLYLKSAPIFGLMRNSSTHSLGFWMFLWLLPFLLFGWIAPYWLGQRLKRPESEARRQKARKVALKRLKAASTALKNQDRDAFFEAVARALQLFLSDRLGLRMSELSLDGVSDQMKQMGVDDGRIAQIRQLLETCEFARFAPDKSIERMQETMEETTRAITELEEVLKKQ